MPHLLRDRETLTTFRFCGIVPAALKIIVFVIVVLADGLGAEPGALGEGRGGRGGLGEEGQTEGGRGRALAGRAAGRTLAGADGLQHASLPLLQHVLLFGEEETQE